MLYQQITELIGNTPLLRLDPARHGVEGVELYAKLEYCNPFGSVKDRIAWGMIRDDLPAITGRGQTLIEASSGNTAKALRVLAAMHGLRLRVLTNRAKVAEVRDLLELLGVELEELPGLSECPDPTVPDDVFSRIEKLMAERPGEFYHTSQYTNPDNVRTHHDTTGQEIAADLGPVDYLFGGLGTTGSTRGAATYLRAANPSLRTIGVVSTREDFIPGIRSEAELWEVGLFEPGFYEQIMPVRPADAIDATLELAGRHGVLAGPTTGAAYWAAREYLRREPARAGPPRRAVIIACDRLEPYLSYVRRRRPELFGQARRAAPGDLPDDVVAAAPELPPGALAGMIGDPAVLCVDTRGSLAYRIGHLPGSVNIPDDHLEDLLRHGNPFPGSRMIVFVCPGGEYSRRLAAFLRQAGHDAASLAGGVVAWRDAGLPLESGLAPGTLPDAHSPQVQLTQVQLTQVHFGLSQLRAASPQLHSTQLHGSQVHSGFSQVVGVLMALFPFHHLDANTPAGFSEYPLLVYPIPPEGFIRRHRMPVTT
jgi:cysteine synthase/rhodanese-related sulfurtransferase